MHRSAKNSFFAEKKSQGFVKILRRLVKIFQDFFSTRSRFVKNPPTPPRLLHSSSRF